MILVLCSAGHVAVAARAAAERLREPSVLVDPAVTRDLFKVARGCRAIVYAPEPRLLDVAAGEGATSAGIRDVVRAAHAPGVERVVLVASAQPSREDREGREQERVLEEDGVPFTIVRSAPLLDELSDATNLHTARSVWLPRGRSVELATRGALTLTIREALYRDDLCGETVFVPAMRMDVVEAMRRAAAIAGAAVKVHATAPGVSSAMRRLNSWTDRRASLDIELLCDRLACVPASPADRRPRPTPLAAEPAPRGETA